MTVAIKESLTKLNASLQNLEKSAVEAQDNLQKAVVSNKRKSGAPDLFSVPVGASQGDVDAKALASRLDGAIAKVEKLLKDEA